MKELIYRRYKDFVASVLIMICIVILTLMDENISPDLRQTLGYILTGCLGFLFRGNI